MVTHHTTDQFCTQKTKTKIPEVHQETRKTHIFLFFFSHKHTYARACIQMHERECVTKTYTFLSMQYWPCGYSLIYNETRIPRMHIYIERDIFPQIHVRECVTKTYTFVSMQYWPCGYSLFYLI